MSEVLGFAPAIMADEALRGFDAGSGHRLLAAGIKQAIAQGEQVRHWLEKYRRHDRQEESGE